jgi:CPA2 family monovalent cation:H+ antiporter-2
MPAHDFLRDLAFVMIVAGVVTVLFHVIRQPVVLGYILAGLLIGPHTPWFPGLIHEESIKTLAEMGVILLMFSLGVHFSLRRLVSVGLTAVIGAVTEIVLMLFLGYQIGRMFGWTEMTSVFLGALLAMSSTTVIIKVLNDLRREREPFAEVIFGILIVEDIMGIAMIALLSGLAVTGEIQPRATAATLGGLALFMTVLLVIGLLTVPLLLGFVARFQNREMMLITALGLCFGVSLLALRMEYSVALGAFLIGAIIAETRENHAVANLIEPVRDMFGAVFFVATGMLLDPRLLADYWAPVLVISAAIVVGKIVSCAAGSFLTGHDLRTSLRVGMGLAQIGEFSFIIAALGQEKGVTQSFLYPITVSVSVLTTLLTPLLIRGSDAAVTRFEAHAPRPLLNYLDLYTAWIRRSRRGERAPDPIRRLVRKTTLQLALNTTLIIGIFLVSRYAAVLLRREYRYFGAHDSLTRALLWLAAMILALPLIVATLRKVRAMAMLISEIVVTRQAAGAQVQTIRAVVTNTLLIAGVASLGLLLLVISSAILPPWPVMAVLLLGLVGIAGLMWKSFIQLYAKAQYALGETLTRPHDEPAPSPAPRPELGLLQDAKLETILIGDRAVVAGRPLRDLQLRAQTGASAIAIERDGKSVVNPGPDEVIQPRDKVLLLGNDDQLGAARTMMTAEA